MGIAGMMLGPAVDPDLHSESRQSGEAVKAAVN